MLDMKQFGRRIAELRHRSGHTQKELSLLLGVSPQAVSKWERGLSFPDMMLLDELASALETEISSLFPK